MAHAYRTSAQVEAPADVVWQILSDVERMPTWTTSMTHVTLLGPETRIAVGSRVEVQQPGLPEATWEVDGLVEGRGFSWSSTTPGVRTGAAHQIAPVSDAACEVTLVTAQSGMLAGLTNLVQGSKARELVDTELAGLKAESELRMRGKG
ncbi:Polyketide cyclase / dehydrase and lipid transport [Promicromonospora umidemergens]|uniref:SRPBCC family protein n=1 Tax=Promicromonospora umidemergens TaxID=629679 RepID=UPI0020A56B85|nr:SRPBCC family protein [Promicromonospora umidemergens]MCP2286421.1 Polyketide cyclase / dehydrase and lipid transport [Promicromonospora umidemergens]